MEPTGFSIGKAGDTLQMDVAKAFTSFSLALEPVVGKNPLPWNMAPL